MNEERAGEYTCRATNQFGISEVTSEVVFTGCTGQSFQGRELFKKAQGIYSGGSLKVLDNTALFSV